MIEHLNSRRDDAPPPERDPEARAMFWFNAVGISLAILLLSIFSWRYGSDFLSLVYRIFFDDNWLP